MSEVKHLRLNVLLVSRRKDTLDGLEGVLRKYPGMSLQRKLIVNGHVDPLHDVDALPDALVLHLAENSRAELESLAARAVNRRPPLIVVGAGSDPAIMRMAMHAGARDLLPLPLVEDDLIAALRRIERDHSAAAAHGEATVTAFMNAKGGCGATLLACNVGHMYASLAHRRAALLDLDLQFGAIPLYFDLFPKRGVLQALENIDSLDEVSFDGYLIEHASGLKILGHAAEDPLSTHVVSALQIRKLLDVAMRAHDHVVIDLPRRIDPTTALILERAHHVAIVVQQSVATLRDATRLANCLRRDLGVSKDRIVTVVNRYQKDSGITTEDIRTTLGCGELSLVPNDFRTVSVCLDTGAPLLQYAPGAAITRAVIALQARLGGTAVETQGFLARKLSGLMKSRTT
jgi:pilus assembly protein CpaE